MAILLKTASVRVSSIQIIQVRVQNKGKSVWKSRYGGDVPGACAFARRSGQWSEQAVDATMRVCEGKSGSQSVLQKNLSMLTRVGLRRSLLQVNL